MNKDSHHIFESYVDGVTRMKGQLAGNIMDIVRYGIPSKEEFIKIRQELHDLVDMVKKRGDKATEEENNLARELIGKIRSYRSQHPDDPPGLYPQKKQEDEEMPYPDFAKLAKHATSKLPETKERNAEEYKEQMPDSREEYTKDEDELSPAEKKRLASNESNWIDMFYRTFGPGHREEMVKNKIDPYDFFVDYYMWMRNSSPEVITKFANLYNSKYPNHEVDIEKLLKMFSDIKDKPMAGYKAPGKRSEDEERRLDPKCWKGYHKEGTKLKGGVRVNNCVKNG